MRGEEGQRQGAEEGAEAGGEIKRGGRRGVALNRRPGRRPWEQQPTDSGDQELQMAFCLDAIKNVI